MVAGTFVSPALLCKHEKWTQEKVEASEPADLANAAKQERDPVPRTVRNYTPKIVLCLHSMPMAHTNPHAQCMCATYTHNHVHACECTHIHTFIRMSLSLGLGDLVLVTRGAVKMPNSVRTEANLGIQDMLIDGMPTCPCELLFFHLSLKGMRDSKIFEILCK